MAAPIERLPVELVDLVVKHFTLPDYQSFRLVSRQIHALTLSAFSSRYFNRRKTTLSPPSLDRLLLVSSYGHLARPVSLLDVKLLNQRDYRSLQKISQVGIYPPPKRFPQVAHVKTQDINQEYAFFEYMRSTDDPKEVVTNLSQALGQLPHIRAVRFRVNGETLHRKSPVRGEEEEYLAFSLACFKATVDAIVRSGIKIYDFSVIKGTKMRPSTKSANLIYPAFHFSFPLLLPLSKAFASLRSLSLSIRTDYNGNARAPGWQEGISQFISTASALEELTLYFQSNDTEPFFRATAMHSLTTSLDLPKLRSLRLYGCVVDEQALSNFTQAHSATVRRLVLCSVRLLNGSWEAVLRAFRASLSLEALHLACLAQREAPRNPWWKGEKKWTLAMDTANKAGRTMNEMLTEAIDHLALISTLPESHSVAGSVLQMYANHPPTNVQG